MLEHEQLVIGYLLYLKKAIESFHTTYAMSASYAKLPKRRRLSSSQTDEGVS